MRQLRADISQHDFAQRFRELGVDVFFGEAAFLSQDKVQVNGQKLEFRRAVIATGARAAKLPVSGWDDVEPRPNETIFLLTSLPDSLTVVGGGPIGCELAQVFARLGSKVTVLDKSSQILSREEPDAARIIESSLARDGVEFVYNAEVIEFQRKSNSKVTVCRVDGNMRRFPANEILIAAGRTPNIEALGLENAGIECNDEKGIVVNDRFQTTNQNVFAAGDVISTYQFTHAADFMARAVHS